MIFEINSCYSLQFVKQVQNQHNFFLSDLLFKIFTIHSKCYLHGLQIAFILQSIKILISPNISTSSNFSYWYFLTPYRPSFKLIRYFEEIGSDDISKKNFFVNKLFLLNKQTKKKNQLLKFFIYKQILK